MALAENGSCLKFRNRHMKEYGIGKLDEASLAPDPIIQFKKWLANAIEAGLEEPKATALSTVSKDGRPSSRIVQLKSFDARGFVFHSNRESRKALELSRNPLAAMLFFWPTLERQVRVEGSVSRTPDEESDVLFASRPRGGRIAAWIQHSGALAGREHMIELFHLAEAKFDNIEHVPRPAHWGGFRLAPVRVEFWQGGENRLHDRIVYEIEPDGWRIQRLVP